MHLLKYIIAIAALLLLFVSYMGWGALVARGLCARARQPWPILAAFGLALMAVLGGVLDRFSLANRANLIGIELIGIVLFLFLQSQSISHVIRRIARGRFYWLHVMVAGAMFYALLAGVSQPPSFDDLEAYLAFPMKLLDNGTLGTDPFSSHRTLASLGGQSFLQAQFLAIGHPRSVQGLDHGLGVVGFLALALVPCRRWNLPRKWRDTIIILTTVIAFGLVGYPNSSSAATGAMLLLAILLTYEMRSELFTSLVAEIAVMALLVAGVATLKSSNMPHAALVVAALYLADGTRPFATRLYAFVAVGILSLAMMMPWMIGMHQNSGTFLYPIFGKGLVATKLGTGTPWQTRLISLGQLIHPLIIAPLIIVFGEMAYLKTHPQLRRLVAVVVAGTAASVIGFLVMGLIRYELPLQYALLAYVASASLSRPKAACQNNLEGTASLFAIVCIALGLAIGGTWGEIGRGLYAPRNFGRRELRHFAAHHRVQQRIDPKETMLVFDTEPFWFDFQRNRVLVWDYPGVVSPPPGLPSLDGDSEELAEYLRSVGVRYVVYSNDGLDPVNRAVLLETLSDRARRIFPRRWALLDRLDELEERYPVTIKSKGLHVLDLAPSTSERVGQP